MTEAEWLASEDPVAMPRHLAAGPGRRPSDSSPRLFARACYRHRGGGSPPASSAFDNLEACRGAEGVDDLSRDAPRLAMRWGEVEGAFFPRLAFRAALSREAVGNPFRPVVLAPAWLTPDVLAVARAATEQRDWGRLPVLGDALEEAGCTEEEALRHPRGQERNAACVGHPPGQSCCWVPLRGPHVLGCWALRLALGGG